MNAPARSLSVDELAEYRSARRDAMAAETMLAERTVECQRLTVELETARAESDFIPGGMCVVEAADVLRTEAIA